MRLTLRRRDSESDVPSARGGLRLGSTSVLLLALLAGTLLVACDDGGGNGEEPDPLPTDPIEVTREVRGFGYFPGDVTFIGPLSDDIQADFSTVAIRAQLLDELRLSRPDGTVPNSLFAPRVEALRSELETEHTPDQTVVILDLMRLSDGERVGSKAPYLVSWDGNSRDLDAYGFWRSDYREAVLAQIEVVAREQTPDIFVVGAEMDRYLDMPGGQGDYANFVTLYRDAYETIKAESPDTRVGAGVNWVRFMQDLVPAQALRPEEIPDGIDVPEGTEVVCSALSGEDEDVQRLQAACVDKAFGIYIEPLLRYQDPNAAPPEEGESPEPTYVSTADVLALAAIGTSVDFNNDPATVPDDFFSPLRRWALEYPVVWYEVDWRTDSAVGASAKDAWLEALIDGNDGVDVDLIAWALFKDLLENDCGKLTQDLGAPDSTCFRGLRTDSAAPKAVHDTFVTDIVP